MAGSVFPLLSKPLRRTVVERGWPRPTRIQELAIPAILEGTNSLLIAPTGTGKTEIAKSLAGSCFVPGSGEYTIHDVEPGRYTLQVLAPPEAVGGETERWQTSIYRATIEIVDQAVFHNIQIQ